MANAVAAAPSGTGLPVGSGAAACYHCGESFDGPVRFEAVVLDSARPMCCAGCAAVAQAIVEAGLDRYYEQRESAGNSQRNATAEDLGALQVFDREDVQRTFTRRLGENEREASLILEGIRCPACIWLGESHIAREPGVIAVQVNYATRRARVRWDARRTRLSGILVAVQAIGYRAYPYDPDAMEASRQRERRDALLRLAVAGLGMMQVMMYAFPAYVAGVGELSADADQLMHWASLVLAFPVVAYSSWPFFAGAVRDLRCGRPGMDVPVALGIGTAFAVSAAATVTGRGEVYFDSVAMFVFFLLGGRYLELQARQRAARRLEYLARSLPALANRLRGKAPDDTRTEVVPAGALQPGDRVLVRPGEAFPADGRIERGDTRVDEGLLTGESRPLAKRDGDAVIAGSVNCGRVVVAEVREVGEATMLSAIVRLMERAAHGRPRIQEIADRVARYFVAFVLAVALAAGLAWAWVDASKVVPVVVSVLVVTCPCALSLATPAVMAIATAGLSRLGLVATRAGAIETLARATHVVFDKTGTLTTGRMRVVTVRTHAHVDAARARELAASLAGTSAHPLAAAIAAETPAGRQNAKDAIEFAGSGIQGFVNGRRLRLGSRAFVCEFCPCPAAEPVREAGGTSVWLGDRDGIIAEFVVQDVPKPEATHMVGELRSAGLEPMILSGDAPENVREIAAVLGIRAFRGGMSPAQKKEAVERLQQAGAVVAMVGDGINDAPVLAQAHVSIALASGAALAQGAADMVLVAPRLDAIADGVRLARKTVRIVRQNLSWAFAYNVVALPLAVAGWLSPWAAGLGMAASSALVVLNALRARREGRGARDEGEGAKARVSRATAPYPIRMEPSEPRRSPLIRRP